MIDPNSPTRDCVIRVDGVDGLALEAELTQGDGPAGAVIAPPHPLYGGSLKNPVVQATAQGFVGAGVSTLAFNYRGTEGSQGVATQDLGAATSDFRAALTELRAHVSGPLIAAGYSFGAGSALLTACDDDVLGVVLVAPPVGMLRSDDLAAFRGRMLVVVGDDDDYAPIPQLTACLSAHAGAELEVLPGVDHFFHFGGLAALHIMVRGHVQTWL